MGTIRFGISVELLPQRDAREAGGYNLEPELSDWATGAPSHR